MREKCLILLNLVFSAIRSEETHVSPAIQVLYPSSYPSQPSSDPALSWLPEGYSWDDPPSSWPGHLEQLGSKQPRAQVNSRKGFPGPIDFYKDYVTARQPIVFKKGVESLDVEALRLDRLMESGLAALSYVDIGGFSTREKERMTVRDFVQRIREPLYLKGNLHEHFKRLVTIPRCLQCSYLPPLLEETRHIIMGHAFPLPVIQEMSDVLSCVLDGRKEILLVDPSVYPEIESTLEVDQSPIGKASLMNSMEVDFEKYPGAAKVKQFHIASLETGDCMYIPGGWVSQTNVLSGVNSIELRWSNEAWSPDEECLKHISPKAKLSQFNFKAENFVGIDPSRDQKGKVVKKTSKMLDWMIQKNFTKQEFFDRISRNQEIIPDLKRWNSECSARGFEMFKLLDTIKNGKLGIEDIEALTETKATRLLGYMEDRLADFEDIVMDQRLDQGPKHLSLTENERADIAETIKKMTKEEL